MWRAAGEIHDGIINPQTHRVINDRTEILDTDLAACRTLGLIISAADDLTVTITAACQQNTLRLRPVVATSVVVDARRMSEFSGNDDQSIVQHASVSKILNQYADTLVMLRKFLF